MYEIKLELIQEYTWLGGDGNLLGTLQRATFSYRPTV